MDEQELFESVDDAILEELMMRREMLLTQLQTVNCTAMQQDLFSGLAVDLDHKYIQVEQLLGYARKLAERAKEKGMHLYISKYQCPPEDVIEVFRHQADVIFYITDRDIEDVDVVTVYEDERTKSRVFNQAMHDTFNFISKYNDMLKVSKAITNITASDDEEQFKL